jgi:hypothetical protein
VIRVPGYRSRGSGFDFRRYQIFWEVVGLERGPFSLVRITEELLEKKVAAPVYKTEINGRGDSLRWPRDTLSPLKLALILPTSGGRSVGIVRFRTKGHGVHTFSRPPNRRIQESIITGFLYDTLVTCFVTKFVVYLNSNKDDRIVTWLHDLLVYKLLVLKKKDIYCDIFTLLSFVNFLNCILTYVGYEVLTAVAMKSSIVWDITSRNPLKVNRNFGGTELLHAGFFFGLFFDHEVMENMFLWNVGLLSTDYTTL